MPIDYLAQSEKYRPTSIERLLVGEAPPPSGKAYFYFPQPMSNTKPIDKDRSLPATIFHHYFQKRPENCEEYVNLLRELQQMGIFLVDIYDDPIKIRKCPEGVKRIIQEIPNLRNKMMARGIKVPDQDIVFLLARKSYLRQIRQEFPCSKYITWKDFRMSSEEDWEK